MNIFLHLFYIIFIFLAFFLGHFSKENPKKLEVIQIAQPITPEPLEKQKSQSTLLYTKRLSSLSKEIKIEKNSTKIASDIGEELIIKKDKKLGNLTQELALNFSEKELEDLTKSKEIYSLIEEKLLESLLEEDSLDIVESYLFDYTKEVSQSFISNLTQSVLDMDKRHQIDFLTLLKENVVASRGYNRENYNDNLLKSIETFSSNKDEAVRFASLSALTESIEEREKLQEHLSLFDEDSSKLIQAKLLLINYRLSE